MSPCAFFDRDGTLMEEVGFCSDPAEVRLIPGAREGLLRLRQAGFRIVVVTNQSGIGRGIFTEAHYRLVEHEFLRQIGPELIDATYYCPDAPDVTPSRRKPSPDMLLDAARDLGLDLTRSFMTGDRAGDIEAGHRAGCRSILVLTGYGTESATADYIAPTVVEACDWILSQ